MTETPGTPVPFATVGEMARWISSNPEDNGAMQEWWQYAAAYVASLEADRDALRKAINSLSFCPICDADLECGVGHKQGCVASLPPNDPSDAKDDTSPGGHS